MVRVPGTSFEYAKGHNPYGTTAARTKKEFGGKYITTNLRGKRAKTEAFTPYARTQQSVAGAVSKQFSKDSSSGFTLGGAASFAAKAAVVAVGVALASKGVEAVYNASEMPSLSGALESITSSSIATGVSNLASGTYNLATDNPLTRGVSSTFEAVDKYILPPVVSAPARMVANTILHPVQTLSDAADMVIDNPVTRTAGYVGSGLYQVVDNPVTRFACNWTVVPAYDLTAFLTSNTLSLGWSITKGTAGYGLDLTKGTAGLAWYLTKGTAGIGWYITKGTANLAWDNPISNLGKSLVLNVFVPPGLRNMFSSPEDLVVNAHETVEASGINFLKPGSRLVLEKGARVVFTAGQGTIDV
ncbi:MAG: hypothetical protein S4CHLAM37_16280 [Chlamydiia bacterium]|nr:hypothetical protein [Chlamydiia bacterium]